MKWIRTILSVVVAATLIGAAPGDDEPRPGYALVATAAKSVKAALTIEVKAPKLRADEWTVYVARIPELPGQTNVRTTLLPKSRTTRELSEFARSVLVDRRPVAGQPALKRQELTVRIEYQATLVARRLERREPGAPSAAVAAIDPRERRLALGSGHQFDFDSTAFQAWLDAHKLRRDAKEADIDFARRAFLDIKRTIKPFEAEKLDRRASQTAQAGKTDGGGIAILYVSALRAGGIPARVLVGRRVTSTDDEPGASQSRPDELQIKTEFHAEGIGWVPVDIASGTFRDESPDGLTFFGDDPADFLTSHVDTDLQFDTYFGRKTEEWVAGVAFYVIGSGTFDDFTTRSTLKVQAEPADLRTALPRKPAPAVRKPQPQRPR